MEKHQQVINDLNDLIKIEKGIYTEAIKNNHGFENVKSLYLKIKRLEHEAENLQQQTASNETIDYSVADEINFLKLKEQLIQQTQEYIAAIENLTLEELINPTMFSKIISLRYHSALAANDLSTFILLINQKNNAAKQNAFVKTK